MAKKRRMTRRELSDLKKIENLLEETKKQPKVEKVEVKPKKEVITGSNFKTRHLCFNNKAIPLDSITLSDHATKRAIERFALNKETPAEEVKKHTLEKLMKAEYIGRVTASDGIESEMFVIGMNSIHLSTELLKIRTVIKYDKLPFNPAHEKIHSLVHKEFRKLDRKEKARMRQLEQYTYEAEYEIAECKLRRFKTRSQSVKWACEGRIAALESRLQELKNEIHQIKTDKRQVAYALASIM